MTTIWITMALTFFFSGLAYTQSNSKVPQAKVSVIIEVPTDIAFNYIVPVDLSHIFKRHKRFPAITKTNETEKWVKAGLTRTIFFEDGSTSKESLLTVIPHTSFSYRIENFTSQLRFLAKRIEGDWAFINLGNNQTKIEWTYKVVPKNFVARGLINLFLMKDINGLLTNALTTLIEDLESGRYKSANN